MCVRYSSRERGASVEDEHDSLPTIAPVPRLEAGGAARVVEVGEGVGDVLTATGAPLKLKT